MHAASRACVNGPGTRMFHYACMIAHKSSFSPEGGVCAREQAMQNKKYVSAPVFLAAFVACCLEQTTAAAGSCDERAPNYLALECRISATNDRCYQYVDAEKTGVNTCSARLPCQVWTGMQLEVSCGDDEDASVAVQDVYRENCTQGRRNLSWPFASKSVVQGVYMCIRSGDGAVISNRSIIVDGEFVWLKLVNIHPCSFCRECSRDTWI